MSAVEIAAIALIAAGILGLVCGGFSCTKETHEAKIGSSADIKRTVDSVLADARATATAAVQRFRSALGG